MARIRTIKPEFPQSESIGKLSRDARLLFVQLFTIVDDAGRTRAASRMLASLLYPYDDDARSLIDGWLTELADGNMIRLYEADGARYLEIVKWLEHQKIDRPSTSKLPAFTEPLAKAREDSRKLDADLVPVPVPVPRTKDQDSRRVADATPPAASRFEEFWKAYPRRKGDNPRKPAEDKFNRLVKTGIDPQVMIDAAKRMAFEKPDQVGTPYIPQAMTWLSQQRWIDHSQVAQLLGPVDDGLVYVTDDAALEAWDAYRRAKEGRTYPRDSRGGWRLPSQYPPGYEPRRPEASPPVIPQLQRMS